MAYFALIDSENIVHNVIRVSYEDCGSLDFPHSEPIGQAFINGPHPHCLALEGVWLQTSYTGAFRGCYAGSGYIYDPVNDVFQLPTTSGAPSA